MELRRLAVLMAFALLAVAQCTEARHSIQRRDADDVNYEELGDEPSDDDTQNDTDGVDADEEKPEIPATVLTTPTNYNVSIGSTVRLECNVTPDSTVVQWFKDNKSYFIAKYMTNTNDTRFSIAPDSKDLIIQDVNLSDNGVYRCETVQKSPAAINHTLVITAPPKIIKFEASDNGRVVEGSDLLLTCDVTGSPQPQILWSKYTENDGNERLNEKDGDFTENTVTIKNIKKEQAGIYLCYAFNPTGKTQEATKVVVFGKPRVHVHKTVVNSAFNMEALLQCSVHEEAPSVIRWYKNGVLLDEELFKVDTFGSMSNLTIVPSTDTDFGTFTCEAVNEHGSHNKSIELVQGPVVEDLNVNGPKLSWTIHSYQPLEEIEVQLRDRNGEGEFRRFSIPVPDKKERKYEIEFMLEDKQLEAGMYEAYVKVKNNNSWGHSSDPAFVDIENRPQLIQASVYRGNNAYSIRPTTTAVLSTILMYLLVRML